MRSQAFFPSSAEELGSAARELLDESIVDAGPLLPQLSGGLVQCRAAEIAPCWVVYVVKRTYANRPSPELVEKLRALPQDGERVVIVELLEDPGQRPLYAEASAFHVAAALPEAWFDDGAAALEPLVGQIVTTLTAP